MLAIAVLAGCRSHSNGDITASGTVEATEADLGFQTGGRVAEVSVKEGDMVQKEQVMGHSDTTGLAAGDHVHFSMQVDGVQVNPIEWWDEHWIKDRVLSKIHQQ